MMKDAIRVFTVVLCVAFLLTGTTLQAAPVTAEKVEIPFDFHVQKHKIMPAGEYRVEQSAGSALVVLVNTKTGERVQMLSSANEHQPGKIRLVFEHTASGSVLKSIS